MEIITNTILSKEGRRKMKELGEHLGFPYFLFISLICCLTSFVIALGFFSLFGNIKNNFILIIMTLLFQHALYNLFVIKYAYELILRKKCE